MFRLTLMVGVILAAVAGLVVAAMIMGLNAERQQQRADTVEQLNREQLWKAYREQAVGLRIGGKQGRRGEGMTVLSKAIALWKTGPRAANDAAGCQLLREEVTALLALTDLKEGPAPYLTPVLEEVTAVDEAQGLLATADRTGHVTVRRAVDGVETARLEPGAGFPRELYLSGLEWRPATANAGGNSWLCAWFKTGDVAMWSLPDQKLCFSWHTDGHLMGGGPSPGHFSRDGHYMGFYTGGKSPLMTLQLDPGKMITHTLPPGRAAFAFRPQSTEIALQVKKTIQLIDFQSGKVKISWPMIQEMHTLTWSADGSRLAGMVTGGEVFIWDLNSQAASSQGGHTAACCALSFSPDGRTLMSSSEDGTTRWWDAQRGSLLLVSTGGKGLSWSKDGTTIRFAATAGGLGQWQAVTSPVFQTVFVPIEEISRFDLSPDGKWLVALQPLGAMLWSTTHPEQVYPIYWPRVGAVLFDPSGGLLGLEDGCLGYRSLTVNQEGVPVVTPAERPVLKTPADHTVEQMTLSQDGHTLLLEMSARLTGIADLRGEKPFQPLSLTPSMWYGKWPGTTTGGGRFSLSPDGRFAAFAYGMGIGSTVFDTSSGGVLFNDRRPAGIAVFSADSQRLLLSQEIRPRVVQTGSWKEDTSRILPKRTNATGAIALSADGLLAAFDITPQTMQLGRGGDLSPLLTLTPPNIRNIRSCRMAADGSRLVVSCSGNEIQIWNLTLLREELAGLGLDWQNGAAAPAVTIAPAASAGEGSRWEFGFLLGIAALAAAVAAVVMLRRHHGLMQDFAGAEVQLNAQRRDLEQANTSLLHSQKMKALGTLAAGMAHDFNNLLSVIRMSNKLISRETRGHAEVTELVESVESAVLQGKKVVSSMLSYSREETGPTRPVTDVVRDTAALLSTEFLSGITLHLDLDEATPAVEVPAGRIEQILLNLIVNASEAMQGNGRLRITVNPAPPAAASRCLLPPHPAAAYVEIAVADTGPGVPSGIADRIFEPFFTTKNAGNDRGTGLGLSMVYTIAERDHMGLALHSIPSEGATFSVFIPITGPGVPERPTDKMDIPA